MAVVHMLGTALPLRTPSLTHLALGFNLSRLSQSSFAELPPRTSLLFSLLQLLVGTLPLRTHLNDSVSR